MRSKLILVATLVLIVLLAMAGGYTARQFVHWIRPVSNVGQTETPIAGAPGAANPMSIVRETNEIGTLGYDGRTWQFTTQGKTKPLAVNAQTTIYLQGETLYPTAQVEAVLNACVLVHCPVYVVWSPQPDVASAIVIALSGKNQGMGGEK